LDQEEVDTASGLRTTTDAMRKELDSLFDAGRGACASLEIAGSSNLSPIGLSEKPKLVPGLVADLKQSAAWGGARTAQTLAKAHYPELNLDLVTSGILESDDDRAPVDEAAIRHLSYVLWALSWTYTTKRMFYLGVRATRPCPSLELQMLPMAVMEPALLPLSPEP
jgi:hypothetical protein